MYLLTARFKNSKKYATRNTKGKNLQGSLPQALGPPTDFSTRAPNREFTPLVRVSDFERYFGDAIYLGLLKDQHLVKIF